MYAKVLFCLIDSIAILIIILTIRAISLNIREEYGKWLAAALYSAVAAILANIMIALSANGSMAYISYCFYFAAIDWIIFFLFGFCLYYTDHRDALNRLRAPVACLMALDNIIIMSSIMLKNVFTVYATTDASGATFYQTSFNYPYYLHLAIDYTAVIAALIFIIHGIRKSISIYRVKYALILAVLILVVVLNIIYMTSGLMLDISVVFYALAGLLIFFSINVFVPRSLLIVATGRAVDEMKEGLMLFDLSENCIYVNSFVKNRFGVRLPGFDLHSQPVATVISELKKSGSEYGEYDYERQSPDSPMDTEHFNFKYDVLTDVWGNTVGSYCLIMDRTETEAYLAEIKKARDEADTANRAKTVFLANMSHEIRTPLNSVLGMNEMILRSAEDPKLIEYAENIKTSGDTLLSLINDILDFSKIEAGKMEITTEDYDPYELLRNAYTSFRQPASDKGLYLRFETSDIMPSRLTGDFRHINEIVSNLISNAIKYTHSGGVTVSMRTVSSGIHTELLIIVSDTGIGISEEDIQFLFDSFKRVNESRNASIQGTGLGLAITKELVEALDGIITVESTPDKGSVFHVSIPQSVADYSPIGPLNLESRKKKAKYQESFHAPDAHILVVDDSTMNLKVMNALLKATEMKVDNASSADEAIEMCKILKYDLIFLDHRMPLKDGIEVFKEISSEGMNTNTPVIMLTANALSGAEDEYTKLGFAGYLSKPVKSNILEEVLLSMLPPDKIIDR
ncbi:MAG: response regulator [Lachnospiraceae bacterium]|nr:response regulator [Lachnospiraceae bacterium]